MTAASIPIAAMRMGLLPILPADFNTHPLRSLERAEDIFATENCSVAAMLQFDGIRRARVSRCLGVGCRSQFENSAAIPNDEFKSEIDMTRSFPRQDQFCRRAPDRIAIYADGGESWCDQT